jgi:hypothetical protein
LEKIKEKVPRFGSVNLKNCREGMVADLPAEAGRKKEFYDE